MTPYNEDVLYNFPMPYNGIVIVSEPVGGGRQETGPRRKRVQNQAIALATMELFFDEDDA